MNPFTGGCHYAGGSCGACPQLGSDNINDLSQQIWKQKLEAYKNLNIHIVALSRWLAGCARESALFSRFPVHLIPNGFPLHIFKPYSKREIRKALDIPESAKVILFGADAVANERKGFRYLLAALNRLSLKEGQDAVILTFGRFPENVKISSKYPIRNMGLIGDETQIAAIYSVADLFVLPSFEDNLPNTVIEAMACGVPVVGFNIGGMPDMIAHKKTGYLARPGDIDGLVEGIKWIISSYDKGVNFSDQCRKKVENEYAPEIQAKAYHALYNQILKTHSQEDISSK